MTSHTYYTSKVLKITENFMRKILLTLLNAMNAANKLAGRDHSLHRKRSQIVCFLKRIIAEL